MHDLQIFRLTSLIIRFRAILDMLGITAFSMKEVDLYGIRKVTHMALERITPGNIRPLHVSFDIDSLDDTEVITTGTPGINNNN